MKAHDVGSNPTRRTNCDYMRFKSQKRADNRRIAEERIAILRKQIEERYDRPELQKRYEGMIGMLAKRYRLRNVSMKS